MTQISAFTKRIPLYSADGKTFTTTKIEIRSDESKIDAKRESKNRDACQQAFLIGLLSERGYEVEINRIYKRGNVTFQMLTIKNVKKDGKVIFDTNNFDFEYHGLKEKRQYTDAMTINCMIDILISEGFQIEERKTRKVVKPNSIGMKRISKIYNDEICYEFKEIISMGKEMYKDIRNKISTKKGFVIQQNDLSISNRTSSTTISEMQ